MYLSELKLWNFRKYSQGHDEAPGIEIFFNKGVNFTDVGLPIPKFSSK